MKPPVVATFLAMEEGNDLLKSGARNHLQADRSLRFCLEIRI